MVRRCFLFTAVLLCIHFAKKAFLLRGYTDTHYKMTISYLYIRYFICGTNKPSTWNFFPALFGICLKTQMPKNSQNVTVCRQFESPRGAAPPLE